MAAVTLAIVSGDDIGLRALLKGANPPPPALLPRTELMVICCRAGQGPVCSGLVSRGRRH
jgi:hypothetical protein